MGEVKESEVGNRRRGMWGSGVFLGVTFEAGGIVGIVGMGLGVIGMEGMGGIMVRDEEGEVFGI